MNNIGRLANGYTLAEILISTLLLSIFAVGTFKSSQFVQTGATSVFLHFMQLHQNRQVSIIQQLVTQYPLILVDPGYQELQCLVRKTQAKQVRPGTNCS